MTRMVEHMMALYGRSITVCRDGKREIVKGFFQPQTGKEERLAVHQVGPLGRENSKRFVYIGPAEPVLEVGDRLEVEGKTYLVRNVQEIWGDGQVCYCWAMCVASGGEDVWGSNG